MTFDTPPDELTISDGVVRFAQYFYFMPTLNPGGYDEDPSEFIGTPVTGTFRRGPDTVFKVRHWYKLIRYWYDPKLPHC